MRAFRPVLVGLALFGPVACGDDIPDAAGSSGALPDGRSTSSGAADDATPETGDDAIDTGSATTDDGPATDTGFPQPEAECGNGFVEEGEQCDDDNRVDDDACNNACQVPCGLQTASLALPPTDESVITAQFVAATPDGGAVVAGLLREITTDQRGNEQVEPDVAQVLRYDARGRLVWSASVPNSGGDLAPAGVAVDGDGEVYIAATGTDPDGTDGIFAVQLGAADGNEGWRHVFDGDLPSENDIATGIALTPDGDIVIAGRVRAGAGDDDVWARKLALADGTEVWTSSYSGVGSGTFSTDDAGPVAVDADGRVWILGAEYVDFETQLPVLLRFAADGGPPELALTQTLAGSVQDYFPIDIEASGSDAVYGAYGRFVGSGVDVRVVRFDGDGAEQWALQREDFEARTGSSWQVVGLATTGDELLIAGRVDNDVTIEDASWEEVWVARVMADGTKRCQAQHRGQARGLLPPSIAASDAAVASDNEGLVSGLQTVDGDLSLWLGRFRPE